MRGKLSRIFCINNKNDNDDDDFDDDDNDDDDDDDDDNDDDDDEIDVQCKLTPHWNVVFAKQLYHDSFRLPRQRLFALQRRYDSGKGLIILQHDKGVQLHDSHGSPTSSKPTFHCKHMIAISCNSL